MRRALALLRPEPGWSSSASAARAAGLVVTGHPLFAAEPADWPMPEGSFDALLVGSAAVFRHGGPQLPSLRPLPVYAVGETTAEAARSAGFTVEMTGEGGLQALLDGTTSSPIRFLRLAGEERVALVPHSGQTMTERAVYRMRSLPIEPAFASVLATGQPLVTLHSARAACHFTQEIDRLGIARGALSLLAIGPRVAEAAGPGWAAVHIADVPNEAALLAKAAALCN